jgi:hypothetical protein
LVSGMFFLCPLSPCGGEAEAEAKLQLLSLHAVAMAGFRHLPLEGNAAVGLDVEDRMG